MILQASNIHRKAGIAIPISRKIDLKITHTTRDKDGHFIIIKGTLHQEDRTCICTKIYKATTDRTKERNCRKNVIVSDLNTPLTVLDRSSKQKINKEILSLNYTLNQMDIIDIHRASLPRTSYCIFPSVHGAFSRIDHMLGHRTSLNKFKDIECIPSLFSDHECFEIRNQ